MEDSQYWRKNLTMAGIMLFAWCALTLAIAFTKMDLTPAYAAIIGIYAWYLRRQDTMRGC